MNFDFPQNAEEFRKELRAFLEQELPSWWRGIFVHDDRAIPFTREFCKKLAQKGWLTISWPQEYGGAGGSAWTETVMREEMWAHNEPRGPQYMNLNYIGPLIMRHGTPEQRKRFLPPMAAGDVLWTQGFSEPGAGSDLASLTTRADVHDDYFVVNGQKIWNSFADAPADWCLLLVRTSRSDRKQHGISILLVDMGTPGITVRPIDSMIGPHDINEIYFEDVVIPRNCLLGPLDNGWSVVSAGLAFERIGVARYARAHRVIEDLCGQLFNDGRRDPQSAKDIYSRHKLADLYVRAEAARLLNYRAISIQAAGGVPTTEASIARVHNTLIEQMVGHVGLDLMGSLGQIAMGDPEAPLGGDISRQWLETIPASVVAGAVEIQKNIIASQSLGLPRSW
jgi:alkylation response protein AidB-like acyl-CoA dehydrogenase